MMCPYDNTAYTGHNQYDEDCGQPFHEQDNRHELLPLSGFRSRADINGVTIDHEQWQ